MSKIGHKIILILLFFIGLLPFLWLKDGKILLGHDNVYPLASVAFLTDRLYSWSSNIGFGMDQSGIQGSLFLHLIDAIPQLIGFSTSLSQRIVFSFWFLAMIFSCYLLMWQLEKKHFIDTPYAKYIAPVLYAVNFYLLQGWWVAERAKFSLVVATPLVLTLLFPLLKEPLSIVKILGLSGISALILTLFNSGGWGGMPLYGGLLVVLGCFYFSFVTYKYLTKAYRDILFLTLLFVFTALWFLLLNAYTLLPFLMGTLTNLKTLISTVGGVQGQISWARYLSENTSILNLLRLQGIPDWYNNGPFHPYAQVYLTQPVLILLSFIFPTLIVTVFFFLKKSNRGIILFFLFLFLISIFFTAGTHMPFGPLYELCMRKIPGFFIFRSPIFKFGYAYWFAASVLLGLSVSYILDSFLIRISVKQAKEKIEIGLLALVIIGLVIYHFPYLTGDIFHVTAGPQRTKVEVPQYVYEFTDWWQQKGEQSKILLLPKLNENWLFEQYTWNYQSLYPLLGNFGSKGIVENLEIMQPQERFIVNILYDAIESKDFPKMYTLSKLLGIQYFLIRGDFAYNIATQETANPEKLKSIFQANSQLTPVSTFGPWEIYQYQENFPLIYGWDTADIVSGDVTSLFVSMNQFPANNVLTGGDLPESKENVGYWYIAPRCLSCAAEINDFMVFFPEIRILPDSPLYPFLQLKNELMTKNFTGESYIFALVGKTLKYVSELEALNLKNKTAYIPQIAGAYIDTIKEISQKVDGIITGSNNPYNFISSVLIYLEAESDYIYTNAFSPDKEILLATQNALFEVNSLINKLSKIFNKDEFLMKKIYSFNLPQTAKYDIFLQDSETGNFLDPKLQVQQFYIDDQAVKSFSQILIEKGSHRIRIILDQPRNLLSEIKQEKIAGSTCISSFSNHYSSQKTYRLIFSGRNTFSDRFYLFVDGGREYAPVLTSSLVKIGNRISTNDYYLEKGALVTDGLLGTIRVSFCAPELTPEIYSESIQNLNLLEVSEPKVILRHTSNIIPNGQPLIAGRNYIPSVAYQKIDPTRYKVSIRDAAKPFYLIFQQAFSPNWQLSIMNDDKSFDGQHFVGNGFNNTWYITSQGTYTLQLEYRLQKYVIYGLIISTVSFISALAILLHTRRQHLL